MKTTKRKKKTGSKSRLPQFLLPAAAVVLLLVFILLLGDCAPPAAPATEPTLPPPEANPYLAEDFEYENGYLTCTVANSMLGIDVSEHQQTVDWTQVKDAGIEFVMIRAGYRGYTEGRLFRDTCFDSHLAGARAAGLKVGVYFFSQAITAAEAREEAAFLLDLLDDTKLQMPVVFDWEYVSQSARTGTMDSRTLTDSAIAFCDAVDAAGYDPMVYFNLDLAGNMLLLEELTQYDFWLAMYSDRMTYPYRVDMWQYTETGTVPGIDGYVDVNLYLP